MFPMNVKRSFSLASKQIDGKFKLNSSCKTRYIVRQNGKSKLRASLVIKGLSQFAILFMLNISFKRSLYNISFVKGPFTNSFLQAD